MCFEYKLHFFEPSSYMSSQLGYSAGACFRIVHYVFIIISESLIVPQHVIDLFWFWGALLKRKQVLFLI